jgi:O-antigen/teichoic acid export membrane protein
MATVPLFLLLEVILPRALGPAAYGNFNFTTALFQNVMNFLDLGTSTCLSTSLSKRPGEFGLVSFYLRLSVIMLGLCVAAGAAVYLPGVGEGLMPGVPLWLALPAALWAYLTWAGRVARGMNDALGLTVRSEMVRVGVNVLSAGALLGMYLWGVLDLKVFFAHQYVFLLLTLAGFCLTLKGSWPGQGWTLGWIALRSYAGEFRRYSTPLFVIALASLLALCGERWMLQFFEGSVEQGYFSLSQKIGLACFLFVTAMTPLLMRELAVAHGKNDPREMARLLDRFSPMLYTVAAWLSCFAFAEASALTRLFGGGEFSQAVAAVQVMALYPMHQSYGQVAAGVYYAAGETKALRNITLLTLVLGLGCAWVSMAPMSMGGLGLGAAGLAWKMVVVQVVTVNCLLIACRRIVPFNFRRNLLHQLVCPAALLALAFAAREATSSLSAADSLVRLGVSGLCYALLSLGAVFLCPFLLGVSRAEILAQARRFKGWLKV